MEKETLDLVLAIVVFVGIAIYAVKNQNKTDEEKQLAWYKPYITKKTLAGLVSALIVAGILRTVLI